MQDDKAAPAKPLAELKNPGRGEMVSMGFGNSQSFELMQRAAKMLAHSTLVPVAYRAQKEIKDYGKVVGYEDNPSALPNCVVALNMAQRMGADPLMIMQNLYIVEGRPSWSSQFIIAAINSCGRYSPLRFDMSPVGTPTDVEYTETKWVKNATGGKDTKQEVKKTVKVAPRTCIAWAIELSTGDRLESPMVSMDMAVAEGWLQKNSSKWQTMPEVMLRYRAAAFFGKLYAPELLMGLQTSEEAHDIIDVMQQPNGQYEATPATLDELRTGTAQEQTKTRNKNAETVIVRENATKTEGTDTETGEVKNAVEPEKNETKPAINDAARAPFESVAAQIHKALNHDTLAEAADLIKSVPDDHLREELGRLYKVRFAELNEQPTSETQEAAAPAKRARRTASSTGAPE